MITYVNGLHGYQFSESEDKAVFTFCKCDEALSASVQGERLDTRRCLERLRQRSGSLTLELVSWLGRGFLTVAWFEHGLISAILNEMLAMGLTFVTANHTDVVFGPARISYPPQEKADAFYSEEIAERKLLNTLRHLISDPRREGRGIVDYRYEGVWNYRTKEGKDFCAELRRARHMSPPTLDDKDNFYRWNQFCSLDSPAFQAAAQEARNRFREATLGASPVPSEGDLWRITQRGSGREVGSSVAPAKTTAEERRGSDGAGPFEEELCLACMERPPETKVQPCGHSVVCRRCSEALQKTDNARVCVKCRRQITVVLDLAGRELAKFS